MSNPPGLHVLRAFGLASTTPEPLPDGRRDGFRAGAAVLTPVADPAQAAWAASVLEHLQPDGIRVARPLRSSDGRWVVDGWSAQRFLDGEPQPWYDEIVRTAVVLHEALAGEPEPRFLAGRDDVYAQADRLAWGADDEPKAMTGDGAGQRLFTELARGREPVQAANQLVHGDLFGAVLFADDQPPGLIDLHPYWRPAGWGAAIVVVDALAWGGADLDLVRQWAMIPQWPQLLRRALMFRLAVSLLHPRTTAASLVEIMTVAEVIQGVW